MKASIIRENKISKISTSVVEDFIKSNLGGEGGVPNEVTHTMYKSLYKYVDQRIPVRLIHQTVTLRKKIYLYGAYPNDVSILHQYTNVEECVFITHKFTKTLNYVRPRYFNSKEGLIILVTPGRDYVAHYVSMVRYAISLLKQSDYFDFLEVLYSHQREATIPQWTELEQFVNPDDIVIIGYVREIQDRISSRMKYICKKENEYYLMNRYRINDKSICFLGVKYSFWGNISGIISKSLCKMGVSEIIYVAKLGDMLTPNNIYNKVYSATNYYLMEQDRVVSSISYQENPLVKMFPELDSGAHVSVPTVLEEQYTQISKAKGLCINTIDNEISHIARSVYIHNRLYGTKIKFSNLHFSTDYVRGEGDKNTHVAFDLSNNKSSLARAHKNRILHSISKYIYRYIASK